MVPRGIPRWVAACALVALGVACSREGGPTRPDAQSTPARPSILFVTLDTTRADAIGPGAEGIETVAFNAVASRARRFTHAYATAPETLPSHLSMLTGLYPAGHGIHENGRHFPAGHPLIAERLQQAGYRTAAFVSSFVLARRFGLSRGFDIYDDEQPGAEPERSARETTERALAFLGQPASQPLFVWVHYFDPHAPYEPPEPFRQRFPDRPYAGEVAAMDEQLGRLVQGFERVVNGPHAIVIAGDHGEGLGDHGESQHGNLLYQSTMHVPLLVAAPGIAPDEHEMPVSTRRVYHTLLDLARLDSTDSLLGPAAEVVLGEAMKPYLQYGWQPQTMAVAGSRKAIEAGTLEVYDLAADPGEQRNLGAGANLAREVRQALEDYPIPSPGAARRPDTLTDEARQRLASLGYIGASAAPVVRKDAPRPIEMTHLFEPLEKASGLFVQERYAEAVPLLETILTQDAHNLDAALRLATAHSSLGNDEAALRAFRKASAIAPQSADVRMYLALHYARGRNWERAVPALEAIVAHTPERLPAVEALARIRERQGRIAEAIALHQRIHALRSPSAKELTALGHLAMENQQTALAIESFEKARAAAAGTFSHDLELGVAYLAARRLIEARDALDRIPASHPDYPMVLFKRAQVSVLLKEPDRAARIDAARRHANATTRELLAREKLFQAAGPQ